ncbi:hypothetical protein Fmac_032259 [Flemingia macrophylla]|uniref:Uncharacterized protein n=1 Tax=Flemingia macrophylla TaxID=520843 RepID=A0ABD1L4V9_9FABA
MLKIAAILDEARSSYATHNRKLKELSLLRSKSPSPSHFFSAFSKTLTPLFDFHRRLASADRVFLLAAAAASNKIARYRACQIVSEHFSVLCAERGIVSHLLLQGEQPEILTGYNLMSTMYGNVTYVPRTVYANREEMLKSYANSVVGNNGLSYGFDIIQVLQRIDLSISPNFMQMDISRSEGSHLRKILVVNEGAGDSVALLGVTDNSLEMSLGSCELECTKNQEASVPQQRGSEETKKRALCDEEEARR